MLNCVILMGRITQDLELKQTPNGVSVTSFSIAVDRNYTPKGQDKQTDFINIVAWRNTAEFICNYFGKGRMIAIEGSIQTRNYEDKNGNKRTAFEVVAEQAFFADSKTDATKTHNLDCPPPNQPFSLGDLENFEEIDDGGELPY